MLQFKHCIQFTIFFPTVNFLSFSALYDILSKAATAHVQGLCSDINWTGQEISWSCLLETGIRNCYCHSNQPTLPTQRGDLRLVCQILNYCKFLFKLKSFVFTMQIWNLRKGMSTSDTHAIKKVMSIRLLRLESGTVTISMANFSLQQWACQAPLQTSITFRDSCFGNCILKGCVLKLSFHLLWWHHFLCYSDIEEAEA